MRVFVSVGNVLVGLFWHPRILARIPSAHTRVRPSWCMSQYRSYSIINYRVDIYVRDEHTQARKPYDSIQSNGGWERGEKKKRPGLDEDVEWDAY